MKVLPRSFPHPVIGNKDDVPAAVFTVKTEVKSDVRNYRIELEVELQNPTLEELIQSGKARYITHVECSNTALRKAYSFSEKNYVVVIPKEEINGNVEINTFACACKTI